MHYWTTKMMHLVLVKDIYVASHIVSFIFCFLWSFFLCLNKPVYCLWLDLLSKNFKEHLKVDNTGWLDLCRPFEDCLMLLVNIGSRMDRWVWFKFSFICEIGSEKFKNERNLSFVGRIHVDMVSGPEPCLQDTSVIGWQIQKLEFLRTCNRSSIIPNRSGHHLEIFSFIDHRVINRIHFQIWKTNIDKKHTTFLENMKSWSMFIPNHNMRWSQRLMKYIVSIKIWSTSFSKNPWSSSQLPIYNRISDCYNKIIVKEKLFDCWFRYQSVFIGQDRRSCHIPFELIYCILIAHHQI